MFKRIALFMFTNIAVLAVLTIFTYILAYFGFDIYAYGDYTYLAVISVVIGFTGSFISLAISRWIAKSTYGIVPVKKEDYYDLTEKQKVVYSLVEDLASRNNIKMPEVGFYNSSEPNAFATGATKNRSLVAVSSGLLDMMDKEAIEGVVGHEMAHILNGDMITMTLLQGVINTFVIFIAKVVANIASNFVREEISGIVRFAVDILLQISLGFLASAITMAFSRHREFKADAGSANFVGKQKMIAGLKALQNMQNKMNEKESPRFATMQISTKKKSGFMKYFSSHPDLEDRIQALENLYI